MMAIAPSFTRAVTVAAARLRQGPVAAPANPSGRARDHPTVIARPARADLVSTLGVNPPAAAPVPGRVTDAGDGASRVSRGGILLADELARGQGAHQPSMSFSTSRRFIPRPISRSPRPGAMRLCSTVGAAFGFATMCPLVLGPVP